PKDQARGIGAHRTGPEAPQPFARRADSIGDTVHGAVDDTHVNDLPQRILRRDPDRLHDRGIVDLVDVVLVLENAMGTGELLGDAVRRVAVFTEERWDD